jgi:G3E family GTPase
MPRTLPPRPLRFLRAIRSRDSFQGVVANTPYTGGLTTLASFARSCHVWANGMLDAAVPLVILTGFLGAGKTTVLNRVLGAQHHRRVAVIVNELGRIDVDGRLLKARAGDVVELAGGCVCHEVRTMDELWEAFAEVIPRSRPDLIVLETTGIAEPAAILAGIAARPPERRSVFVARVVTVVDANAGLEQLARHAEARAQVEGADRLLLSKLDLVTSDRLLPLHRTLAQLNPEAERASFPPGAEATSALVPWLLEGLEPRTPAAPRAHTPHAHGQLVAAAFVEEAPLLAEPLLAMCRRLGPALVRAKGFVHLAGEPRQGFLERAGRELELRLGEPWPPGARRSEIVLIGEDLDLGSLQRQLWGCRAPAGGAGDV